MSVVSESLTGKSLLDVIETRFQDSSRGDTVTRVIFGASFGEGSSAEKVTALAQKAKATAEDVDVSSSSLITGGLLILSNTAIAGFLEASPRKLYSLLGSFSSSPLLDKVRVVANIEDAPTRSFNHYGVYSANPPSSGDVDVSAEGPTVVAGEVLKSLQGVPFPEGGEGIVGLGRTAPSDTPSASKIMGCCDCEAYPTLEEYLELFASPVSVEVESEMVWPLQSAVSWT